MGWDSCVLTELGTMRCWGDNEHLQLGRDVSDTDFDRTNTPGDVVDLGGATAIGAGYQFNCALSGGAVKCWGLNASGQLGGGNDIVDSESLADSMTPVTVAGLSGVTALTVGDAHACAITGSGAVKCWGDGNAGQLGDGVDLMTIGENHISNEPVDVVGLSSGVKFIAAHGEATCAVTSANGVKCWGYGQSTATDVPGLESGVAKIFVGGASGFAARILCAVTTEGAAKCLGNNGSSDPMLGRGTDTTTAAEVPTQVVGLASGVTTMALGTRPCAPSPAVPSTAGAATSTTKCWAWASLRRRARCRSPCRSWLRARRRSPSARATRVRSRTERRCAGAATAASATATKISGRPSATPARRPC